MAKKKAVFEVLKNSEGQFYFTLVAPNGEIILTSEMYIAKASALKGIRATKKYAKTAKVEDKST